MKNIIYLLAISLLFGCSIDNKATNSQFNVEFLADLSCTSSDFNQTHLVDDDKDEYSKNIIKETNELKEQCEIFNTIYKSSEDIYNKLSVGVDFPEIIYLATINMRSADDIKTLNIGYFHSMQECKEFT